MYHWFIPYIICSFYLKNTNNINCVPSFIFWKKIKVRKTPDLFKERFIPMHLKPASNKTLAIIFMTYFF